MDPIHFRRVQIILERSKLSKISQGKSNLNLTKIIWTQPKRFGLDQNNLELTTIQNYFGPTLMQLYHSCAHFLI